MSNRLNISSGAEWEDKVGYSRAVRIGNTIEVSGTVALKDGILIGKEDPYVQMIRCCEIIKESLEHAGGQLSDVIRTRIYVVNIEDWPIIGKAHGEIFNEIKPATSMVEVSKLIDSACLVEVEATAIIS